MDKIPQLSLLEASAPMPAVGAEAMLRLVVADETAQQPDVQAATPGQGAEAAPDAVARIGAVACVEPFTTDKVGVLHWRATGWFASKADRAAYRQAVVESRDELAARRMARVSRSRTLGDAFTTLSMSTTLSTHAAGAALPDARSAENELRDKASALHFGVSTEPATPSRHDLPDGGRLQQALGSGNWQSTQRWRRRGSTGVRRSGGQSPANCTA